MKTRNILTPLLALTLVAAACSGDDDSATDPPAPTVATDGGASTSADTTTNGGGGSTVNVGFTGQWVRYSTIADFEAATGETVDALAESPSLADSGLPSVDERVPVDAQVMQPADEIGTYGGTFVAASASLTGYLWEFPLSYAADLASTAPNIWKSVEANDDATVYTVSLREGLKWSDGEPMTADDWVWYYDNILLNEEVWPDGRSEYQTESGMGSLAKIDDYTIEYTFAEPYGLFPLVMSRVNPAFTPVHYTQQFHPDFADPAELQAAISDSGLTDWTALWEVKESYTDNPEIPTIFAWQVTNEPSAAVRVLKRNSYYWKVDPAGNQLPYIDTMQISPNEEQEVVLVQAIAGEVDLAPGGQIGGQSNYALLADEQSSGAFQIVPRIAAAVTLGNIQFNYSIEDPVLNDLFNSFEFREALSIGTDRDEINAILFNGLLTPSQWAPAAGAPYDGDRDVFTQYASHDIEQANALLDGLDVEKNDDGIRQRPDGGDLEIVMFMMQEDELQDSVAIAELIKIQWERDLGIKINIRPRDGDMWGFAEGEEQGIHLTAFGMGEEYPATLGRSEIVVPLGGDWPVHGPWSQWVNSGGEEGTEPPAAVQELADLARQFQAATNPTDAVDVERQIAELHANNLFVVGLLKQEATFPLANYNVFSSRVGNVSTPSVTEYDYMALETLYLKS